MKRHTPMSRILAAAIEWLDAGGFQLGDTLSNWQPGTIGGNERKVLTGVGPGPQASDFRLYLRSPAS